MTKGRILDLIIDGDDAPGGVESTVVCFSEGVPEVVRESAISKELIMKVCREAGLCA